MTKRSNSTSSEPTSVHPLRLQTTSPAEATIGSEEVETGIVTVTAEVVVAVEGEAVEEEVEEAVTTEVETDGTTGTAEAAEEEAIEIETKRTARSASAKRTSSLMCHQQQKATLSVCRRWILAGLLQMRSV
jgi:hypothetical protein